MSQHARENPEEYRRKELEHVPAKWPGHIPTPPPAASDAEREFLLGLHGYGPQAINAIEVLPLDIGRLRAHTREAVSQAVGALEKEVAGLKTTIRYKNNTLDCWNKQIRSLQQAASDREWLRACVVRLSGHVSMLLAKVEGRVHDENDTVEAAAKAELTALREAGRGGE